MPEPGYSWFGLHLKRLHEDTEHYHTWRKGCFHSMSICAGARQLEGCDGHSCKGGLPSRLSYQTHEMLICQTGAGASMDQYQVYCHLMRNGFIVTR